MMLHAVKQPLAYLAYLVACLCAVVLMGSSAHALSGSEFQANRIIDDAVFYNGNAMSADQIQSFLNSKVPTCDTNGSVGPYYDRNGTRWNTRADYGRAKGVPPPYICLKDFRQDHGAKSDSGICAPISAKSNRSAAQIIDDVARACSISQKALLVTLQKEQSLITDDWPFPVQYEKAMGYYCPDDPNNPGWCHPDYAGFFNQVYNAAKQFVRYKLYPENFNHAVGRTSYIAFQANNSSCGGTNLTMQNAATAGLYNYTPYQPNAAALNNLYGTGDGCSAYGNRNFWRMFNDWFGSTLINFQVIEPESGGAIYITFDGMKQLISDLPTLKAWGFDRYSIQKVSNSYIDSLPTYTSPLTRYVNPHANDTYYVDSQTAYYVNNTTLAQWGHFGGQAISAVYPKIMPLLTQGGNMGELIKTSGSETIYMVDGGLLRPFTTYNTFEAWERPNDKVISISNELFSEYNQGSPLSTNLVTTHYNEKFLISNDHAYTLSGNQRQQLPGNWAETPVSNATLSARHQKPLEISVQENGGNTIYLLDGGTIRPFVSYKLYANYASNRAPSILHRTLIDSMPLGSNIDRSLFSYGGTNGILDHEGKLYCFDPDTTEAFSVSTLALPLNSSLTLAALLSRGCISTASPYIKISESPVIFAVSGNTRLPFADLSTLFSFTPSGNLIHLLAEDLNLYSDGPVLKKFIGDSAATYLVNNGMKVNSDTQIENWQLVNPIILNNGLLKTLPTSSYALSNHINIDGTDYLIDQGAYYRSPNHITAINWSLKSNNISLSKLALTNLYDGGDLSFLVQPSSETSPYRGALYTISDGKLLLLTSMDQLANFRYLGQAIKVSDRLLVDLEVGDLSSLHTYLISNGQSTYVMDNGLKRLVGPDYIDNIVGSAHPTRLSDSLLDVFPAGDPIRPAVSATGYPTILYMEDGTPYGYANYQEYQNSPYAPATHISQQLMKLILK